MMECPFCFKDEDKLILSTPQVIAFMDIQPLVASQAHVLVAPRHHYETLDQLADNDVASAELGKWLVQVAATLREIFPESSYNIVQNNGPGAGQVVPHVHFHFILRGRVASVEGGAANNSAGDSTALIVEKLRSQVTWRDRLAYSSTVFGKGVRGEKDTDELATRLRKRLRQQALRIRL